MATISIIGAGSVGRALAAGLAGAGHAVVHGVRDPDDPRHADLDHVATPAAATSRARVVVLAVPAAAVAEVVPTLELSEGRIVVDATNAVGMPVPGGHATMGDLVASLLPSGVAMAKAFNTIGAEHLGDGRIDGHPTFLPVAGDPVALELVVDLAEALGHDAVAVGGREAFGLVEAHARLWIHLAFARGWGRGFGFTVVGR